jgi:AraC-like DNA-binding protein
MGANELLKEAYYRKAWQSAASSAGLALSLLAIADQYAEKLGPYQYQRFSSSIQPLLKEIRLSVVDGDLPQSLLKDGQPLTENVARQERMQKLLKEALTLPPSPPPAAKPVTDAPSLQQQRLPAVEGSFLQRIRRIVEANLPDPQFSIQDLSRTMCISHSQLHRRLQASTGQSATEFIRSIRMDHAKKLLLKPVLTVTEVAYHTGFKDPAYFHRVFKKTFGMTPTAYREMITPAPAE